MNVERAQEIIRNAPRGPYKLLGIVTVTIDGAPIELTKIGYEEKTRTPTGAIGLVPVVVCYATSSEAARYITGSSNPAYGWAALLDSANVEPAPAMPTPQVPEQAPAMERIVERAAQIIADRITR